MAETNENPRYVSVCIRCQLVVGPLYTHSLLQDCFEDLTMEELFKLLWWEG